MIAVLWWHLLLSFCTLVDFGDFCSFFFNSFARLTRQDLILNSPLCFPQVPSTGIQRAVRHWNELMMWDLGIVVSYLLSDVSQCFPQLFIGLMYTWWGAYSQAGVRALSRFAESESLKCEFLASTLLPTWVISLKGKSEKSWFKG